MLGKHVDLLDVSSFDPQLGHTLERMRAALANHTCHTSHTPSGTAKGELMVDGVPVSDLCLTFTLPGYPDYELVPGGGDVEVTADNLGHYIDAVVDATLGAGIEAQLKAFREGFNEVCTRLRCGPERVGKGGPRSVRRKREGEREGEVSNREGESVALQVLVRPPCAPTQARLGALWPSYQLAIEVFS